MKQTHVQLAREAMETAPSGEFTTSQIHDQVLTVLPEANYRTTSSIISVSLRKGKIVKVRPIEKSRGKGYVYSVADDKPVPAPFHKVPPSEPLDVQAEVTVEVETNLDYAATGKAISEYVRQVEGEVAKLRTDNIDLKAAMKAASAEHSKQVCDYKRQLETLNQRLTERNQMIDKGGRSTFKLGEVARYKA